MDRLYLQKHDACVTRCELVLEQNSIHAGTAEDYARVHEEVDTGDRLIIVSAANCYVYDVVKPEVSAALTAPNGKVV